MKNAKAFVFWVSVRLAFAMLIPLKYTYSQGFMGSQTAVYAMIWSWEGICFVHVLSVLAAILISTPAVLFAVDLKRSCEEQYPVRTAIVSSSFLLLFPFLEIPNLLVRNESVPSSPYLASFGFCSMLWLLFVLIPSFVFYTKSITHTAARQVRIVSMLGFALALGVPFLGLEYHGVLGFDETYILAYVIQISYGRWGLTNETVVTSAEPLAEFSTLAAYLPVILLTVPRLLFALYLTKYLTRRASLAAFAVAGVTQELITALYVLVVNTATLPTPGTTRYLVPLPILLPSLLVLSWAVRYLGRADRASSLGQEEVVEVPFLVRTRSRLLVALGRHSKSDLKDDAALEEDNKTVQQP